MRVLSVLLGGPTMERIGSAERQMHSVQLELRALGLQVQVLAETGPVAATSKSMKRSA